MILLDCLDFICCDEICGFVHWLTCVPTRTFYWYHRIHPLQNTSINNGDTYLIYVHFYALIISCQHWHMPFNHDHTCTLLWFRRHTFLCILTIPRWWWHNKITANELDSHQMTRWLQILVKLVLTLMISPPLVYTYIPSLYYCAILFINDMVYYWCVVDDPKTP